MERMLHAKLFTINVVM